MGNLEGLFDTVNAQVGEIAVQVGDDPGGMERRGFPPTRSPRVGFFPPPGGGGDLVSP